MKKIFSTTLVIMLMIGVPFFQLMLPVLISFDGFGEYVDLYGPIYFVLCIVLDLILIKFMFKSSKNIEQEQKSLKKPRIKLAIIMLIIIAVLFWLYILYEKSKYYMQ